MPNEADTENNSELQPGQKVYVVVRSDGERAPVLGYASRLSGDWFVIAMTEDETDPKQQYAYVFRPIAVMEITAEQYLSGEWQ
ncbi:hypothetical protein [Sphingomonas sp.]|uniref:hypothetical protein n=1 Tax=Sphingomonas sp. TaxID=28214 RepID=UPI003B3A4154